MLAFFFRFFLLLCCFFLSMFFVHVCAVRNENGRCYEEGDVIRQETRLWDEKKKATQIMRVKEGAYISTIVQCFNRCNP